MNIKKILLIYPGMALNIEMENVVV